MANLYQIVTSDGSEIFPEHILLTTTDNRLVKQVLKNLETDKMDERVKVKVIATKYHEKEPLLTWSFWPESYEDLTDFTVCVTGPNDNFDYEDAICVKARTYEEAYEMYKPLLADKIWKNVKKQLNLV